MSSSPDDLLRSPIISSNCKRSGSLTLSAGWAAAAKQRRARGRDCDVLPAHLIHRRVILLLHLLELVGKLLGVFVRVY